jgi:hypothetical protein
VSRWLETGDLAREKKREPHASRANSLRHGRGQQGGGPPQRDAPGGRVPPRKRTRAQETRQGMGCQVRERAYLERGMRVGVWVHTGYAQDLLRQGEDGRGPEGRVCGHTRKDQAQ